MRAQPAKARPWVCDYCGGEVPANYAHKCLQYDRAADDRVGSVVYLWPSKNLREIAEKIEEKLDKMKGS